MTNLKYLYIFSFAFITLGSCQDEKRQNEEQPEVEEVDMAIEDEVEMDSDVYNRINEDEELRIFSTGMTRAGLSDDFSEGEGPFTIFAPNNTAFENLSEEERAQFGETADTQELGAGTNYFVVERRLTADSLRRSINNVGGSMELITMQGEQLMATLQNGNIVLRDGRGTTATIVESDMTAANGVVHVIDKVLRPLDITRNDAEALMGVETNENNGID